MTSFLTSEFGCSVDCRYADAGHGRVEREYLLLVGQCEELAGRTNHLGGEGDWAGGVHKLGHHHESASVHDVLSGWENVLVMLG